MSPLVSRNRTALVPCSGPSPSQQYRSVAFAPFLNLNSEVALIEGQIALRSQKKSIIFVENLPKLNEALPAFGAQLPLFPDVPQVQVPLQNVFREYMECYSIILTQF